MKINNKPRRQISVPIVDIFIILLIIAGVAFGAVKLVDRSGGAQLQQYRVDVVLKDSDGNAMRVSNGTTLYFEDGTTFGTAKLFGSSIYTGTTASTFNASVLIRAERRPDALYCEGKPLLIGSEIKLHSKSTELVAIVVSWSEIGDDAS